MNITEGIANEEVDVSRGEEQVAEEAKQKFTRIASTAIDTEWNNLREDHNEHGCDGEDADD